MERRGWWSGAGGFSESLVVRDTEGRFVDRLGFRGVEEGSIGTPDPKPLRVVRAVTRGLPISPASVGKRVRYSGPAVGAKKVDAEGTLLSLDEDQGSVWLQIREDDGRTVNLQVKPNHLARSGQQVGRFADTDAVRAYLRDAPNRGEERPEHAAFMARLADNPTLTLSPSGNFVVYRADTGREWSIAHAVTGKHLGTDMWSDKGGKQGALDLVAALENVRDADGNPPNWDDPSTFGSWRDSAGDNLGVALQKAKGRYDVDNGIDSIPGRAMEARGYRPTVWTREGDSDFADTEVGRYEVDRSPSGRFFNVYDPDREFRTAQTLAEARALVAADVDRRRNEAANPAPEEDEPLKRWWPEHPPYTPEQQSLSDFLSAHAYRWATPGPDAYEYALWFADTYTQWGIDDAPAHTSAYEQFRREKADAAAVPPLRTPVAAEVTGPDGTALDVYVDLSGFARIRVEPYRTTDPVSGKPVEVDGFYWDASRPYASGFRVKKDGTTYATRGDLPFVSVPPEVTAAFDAHFAATSQGETRPEPDYEVTYPRGTALQIVDLQHVSGSPAPAGTWEGTVAPGSPPVYRNVGNWAELDSLPDGGAWMSNGGFTALGLEGATQFATSLDEVAGWRNGGRDEPHTPLIVEVDVSGLPVRFASTGGNLDAATGTYRPDTGLGLGVESPIDADRVTGAYLGDTDHPLTSDELETLLTAYKTGQPVINPAESPDDILAALRGERVAEPWTPTAKDTAYQRLRESGFSPDAWQRFYRERNGTPALRTPIEPDGPPEFDTVEELDAYIGEAIAPAVGTGKVAEVEMWDGRTVRMVFDSPTEARYQQESGEWFPAAIDEDSLPRRVTVTDEDAPPVDEPTPTVRPLARVEDGADPQIRADNVRRATEDRLKRRDRGRMTTWTGLSNVTPEHAIASALTQAVRSGKPKSVQPSTGTGEFAVSDALTPGVGLPGWRVEPDGSVWTERVDYSADGGAQVVLTLVPDASVAALLDKRMAVRTQADAPLPWDEGLPKQLPTDGRSRPIPLGAEAKSRYSGDTGRVTGYEGKDVLFEYHDKAKGEVVTRTLAGHWLDLIGSPPMPKGYDREGRRVEVGDLVSAMTTIDSDGTTYQQVVYGIVSGAEVDADGLPSLTVESPTGVYEVWPGDVLQSSPGGKRAVGKRLKDGGDLQYPARITIYDDRGRRTVTAVAGGPGDTVIEYRDPANPSDPSQSYDLLYELAWADRDLGTPQPFASREGAAPLPESVEAARQVLGDEPIGFAPPTLDRAEWEGDLERAKARSLALDEYLRALYGDSVTTTPAGVVFPDYSRASDEASVSKPVDPYGVWDWSEKSPMSLARQLGSFRQEWKLREDALADWEGFQRTLPMAPVTEPDGYPTPETVAKIEAVKEVGRSVYADAEARYAAIVAEQGIPTEAESEAAREAAIAKYHADPFAYQADNDYKYAIDRANTAVVRRREARTKALLDALASVRDMGGELEYDPKFIMFAAGTGTGERRNLYATLRSAYSVFPKDWIDTANRSGPLNVEVPGLRGRAHYTDDGIQGDPAAPEGYRMRNPKISVYLEGTPTAALHELTHLMTSVNPRLAQAESAYFRMRTTETLKGGKRVQRGKNKEARMSALLPGLRYGPHERAVEDDFPHPYSGRVYREVTVGGVTAVGATVEENDGKGGAAEVLTTTLETVFGTETYADEDMVDFALGALAVL